MPDTHALAARPSQGQLAVYDAIVHRRRDFRMYMLKALRAGDALAIAEISRRRSRDEQGMAQYLGIGRESMAQS
jgi:hypothetical protein